jgi:uncharacterized protein YdbL (DUF1318 family)
VKIVSASDKIVEYGKELGIENANVDDFIAAHRALYKKAQDKQQLWHDLIQEARNRAYQQVMDATWVRIEDLKKMSVQELVSLLNDD